MVHQREGTAQRQGVPGTIASAQANLAIVENVGAGKNPVALAGFKIQRDLSFARQTKAETCKPDIPAEAHRLIFPRRLRLQLRVGPDCPVAASHGEARGQVHDPLQLVLIQVDHKAIGIGFCGRESVVRVRGSRERPGAGERTAQGRRRSNVKPVGDQRLQNPQSFDGPELDRQIPKNVRPAGF